MASVDSIYRLSYILFVKWFAHTHSLVAAAMCFHCHMRARNPLQEVSTNKKNVNLFRLFAKIIYYINNSLKYCLKTPFLRVASCPWARCSNECSFVLFRILFSEQNSLFLFNFSIQCNSSSGFFVVNSSGLLVRFSLCIHSDLVLFRHFRRERKSTTFMKSEYASHFIVFYFCSVSMYLLNAFVLFYYYRYFTTSKS